MAESKEEIKSLLMRMKEKREKASLKFNIQKTKIMASGPISSWQIDGANVEIVTYFILEAPKSLQTVTKLNEACSLEKSNDKPRQHILKSRHITLPTKVPLVKAMVFPVVMYGCETWTIKKAEHPRTDAFELCWRRLESPLDCKEIQPVHPKRNQF